MLRTRTLALALLPGLAALAGAGCSCGDAGPAGQVVLAFDDGCGGADGCDLDLSCLGAVALRAWTPAAGLRETCLRGDALTPIAQGCDLDALDVALPLGSDEGPVIVELLGFAGDDCAPAQDASARLLFEGLSGPVAVGDPIPLTLTCSAGCEEGEDACEDSDDCTCCAGICVDDDAMLHCGACFTACDPYRADMCDDGDCFCGDGPACADVEVCCRGACAPVGTCAPADCPFASGDACTNPSTDVEACGGGLDADACSSERADACFAGGCTCGGGPRCAESSLCLDGRCVP